jgi:hypothetical protein
MGVVGLRYKEVIDSGSVLEKHIIEGENPVHEIDYYFSSILSKAGPEKSCLNLPAPSGKAKYY